MAVEKDRYQETMTMPCLEDLSPTPCNCFVFSGNLANQMEKALHD